MVTDRMKSGLAALLRALLPTIDYQKFYPATVVKQSGDRTQVDVDPDDAEVPGMQNIPLKTGLQGVTVKIGGGFRVLVGWEGGDPQRPMACLHPTDRQAPEVISIHAAKIELGGEGLQPLLEQLVLGRTTCQFSGAPHHIVGNTSTKVLAKG